MFSTTALLLLFILSLASALPSSPIPLHAVPTNLTSPTSPANMFSVFTCVPGTLPMDPESCYWFVIALMEQPWAPLRAYFSNSSPVPYHLPIFSTRLGCELSILTLEADAGATFALVDLRGVMNAMIRSCLVERKMVGTAKIMGDRGTGLAMTITGYTGKEQVRKNLTVTSGVTVDTA